MRHGLRVLLIVSAIALVASAATMAAVSLSNAPSASHSAGIAGETSEANGHIVAGRGGSGRVTDAEVCGMVTSAEVNGLLNYPLPPIRIGPGRPAYATDGGACAWGTGRGETFEVKVIPRTTTAASHPCAGIAGAEVRADGWIGCSRLDFGNDNVFRAFEGPFAVSIRPQVNVIGFRYLQAEESTVTHVFQELGE